MNAEHGSWNSQQLDKSCGAHKKLCKISCKHRYRLALLPSLRRLIAISLAFLLGECACIIAVAAAAFCYVCRPVSAYALAIYPYLTFAHAHHIQTQWIISSWRVKCSLERNKTDWNLRLAKTYQLDQVCSNWSSFDKFTGSATLYHVRGCFWARRDPCVQSTEELPVREERLSDSPLRPVYPWGVNKVMVL